MPCVALPGHQSQPAARPLQAGSPLPCLWGSCLALPAPQSLQAQPGSAIQVWTGAEQRRPRTGGIWGRHATSQAAAPPGCPEHSGRTCECGVCSCCLNCRLRGSSRGYQVCWTSVAGIQQPLQPGPTLPSPRPSPTSPARQRLASWPVLLRHLLAHCPRPANRQASRASPASLPWASPCWTPCAEVGSWPGHGEGGPGLGSLLEQHPWS